MIDQEIYKFYEDVGYAIPKLFRRKPYNLSDDSIKKAAKEVFDDLYCFELINIPREIFRRAMEYNETTDKL